MSRKTLMATALAACLAVLFFAVNAADRNRRVDAERTQRGTLAKAPAPKVDIGAGYIRELDPTATDEPWDEPGDAPVDIQTYLDNLSAADSARVQGAVLDSAAQLLRRAERLDGAEAIPLLNQLFRLRLDDSDQSHQIQVAAHLKLAELMDVSSRKEFHLRAALNGTTDSALRTQIEQDILAIGGSIDLPTRAVARDFGPDDQCTNSIPVGLPGSVTMSVSAPIVIPGIPNPIVDRNFVSFDIPLIEPGNPHDPLVGAIVKIDSTSPNCSTESECSAAAYDTLLRLWGGCASDGFPELLVQADDEGGQAGDSGLGWLSALDGRGSCIDETGKNSGKRCFVDADCQASQGGPNSHGFCSNTACLPAGTYYIEALGEFGSSPQNFNVTVSQIGTCLVPRGDSYEADNQGVDATNIGWPTSKPGNGNGRANKEIQGHTILANGTSDSVDIDNVKVGLSGDEMVRFSTAVTQPKPSNGYFYRPASQESDTAMKIKYADDIRGQAGLCNHNSSFRSGSFISMGCYSSQTNFGIPGLGPDEDGDCIAGIAPRFFNVPSNWCVPNYMVSFLVAPASGVPNFFEENPMIAHDDNDPASADYGSTIELCLPKSGAETIPNDPLVANITSSPANPRSPLLNYFYETRAQTLTPCTFEREPNNSPFQANAIALGQSVYGINDTSETRRTNVILPVRRCSTAPTQRCYASPRPAGTPNIWGAIVDVCPGGGTCNTGTLESAVAVLGFQDIDYWSFDLPPGGADVIATLTPKIIDAQGDTELFIRVGPADIDGDGFDDFPLVIQDDDAESPASKIGMFLPSAAEYLASEGIPGQNPKYFLVAGIATNLGDDGSSIPNHYYELSLIGRPPIPETEPNNDCLVNAESATLGDAFEGSLSPSGGRYIRTISGGAIQQDCDIDAYRISITENTRITFSTEGDPATTDTAIQLEKCDGSGEIIACDEDGQFDTNGTYWSILEGCLPPGDYCLRVRAWSGLGPELFSTPYNEYYKLKFKGTAGCDPSADPVIGDGASSCRVGGSRGPFDTFCDGDSNGYPAFTACGDARQN